MSSTAGTETDPSPNRTGLVKALGRRSKRNMKEDVSLNSSRNNSTISIDDGKETHRSKLRGSIDAAIEKIKTGNTSERRNSEPKALQGLQGLLRRRTKKKSRRASLAAEAEEVERGRSVAKRGTLEDPIESSNTSGAGGSSGHLRDEVGHSDQDGSSLITDDSETESSTANPPPLTSHPSHAGYLTLSSPLMRPAPTVDESKIPLKHTDRSNLRSNLTSPSSPEPTSGFTSTVARVATLPTLVGSSPSSSTDLTGGTKNATVTTGKLQEPSNGASLGRSTSRAAASGPSLSIDPNAGVGAGQSGTISPRRPDEDRVRGREEGPTSLRPGRVGPSSPPSAAPARDNARPTAPLSPLRQLETAPRTPPFQPGTPQTTITPPTPTDFRADPQANALSPTEKLRKSTTGNVNPGAGQMLSHRRVQSASLSSSSGRPSHNIPAPLTPTIEEPRSAASTPGISGGNSGQGGFFSSVFSAAQNAASTLSNSIANTSLGTTNRKNSTQAVDDNRTKQGKVDDTSVSVTGTEKGSRGETADGEQREQRPLAVETLGMGELSLSHLGISVEPPPESAGPNSATGERIPLGESQARGKNGMEKGDDPGKGQSAQRVEDGGDPTTGPAVELIYDGSRPGTSVGPGEPNRRRRKADSISGDSSGVPVVEDVVPGARPRSAHEPVVEGISNPSSVTEGPTETGLKRGGSLRSRFDGTVRRKRGSSAATGTTIATAIGINATTNTPISPARFPRVTGFAVASKKRNRDFHQLFKTVPEDDYLIEDYSAAIQRDILLHGRLYISEGHICFNSNILGYVTTLVIRFDEVVSIEKKNTAILFPNAIVISTLHARNVFASLASRDSTYDLIVGIWKIGHPNLRNLANGVQLEETEEKTVKPEASSSDGLGDEDEDEEAVYDEDAEEDEGIGSFTEAGEGSMAGSEVGDAVGKTPTRRAVSAAQSKSKGPTTENQVVGDVKGDKGANGAPVSSADFPGPATHRPTECSDQDKHFDKVVSDEVLPAPLGKIYSLMFGSASGAFLATLLHDEQKVLDLQLEDDKMGLTDSKKTRTYSYIKPLNASIGPRQTKCIINETLEVFDLEKTITVTVVTQTPDVPSGNVFMVKTKYCLTWADGNGTRVLVTCTIEWTGKSWLKEPGPIEKGANEGQATYSKDLMNALRSAISSKAAASGSGVKGRIRRRKKEIAEISAQAGGKPAPDVTISYGTRPRQGLQHWGVFEPIRKPLSPVLDILTPLITQNMALGFIVFWLLLSSLRPNRDPYWRGGAAAPGYPGLATPERLAAYEEIWRKEENGLWEWLDERVGVERFASARKNGQSVDTKQQQQQQRIKYGSGAELEAKVAEEAMSERQIEEAIRVTQETLDELKRIVKGRKKMEGGRE
ncbi:MAG: hypothetical protein M1816_007568 [Peltula sp. TS41687]|nr:MAG: hypothetical protein M1816_007568 [Peltula sp. TS41687]